MKKLKLDNFVKIYDNKGKTFDRYTAVYITMPENKNNIFEARGMSEFPFHPQGFGQSCSASPGRHLGVKISLNDLPKDCQRLVLSDLKDIIRWHEGFALDCSVYCDYSHQINEMIKGL